MIAGITGRPGNGKGRYFAVKMVEVLVNTDAVIITNFGWECLPWCDHHHKAQIGMREYLLWVFGNDFNIRERVFDLDDEQDLEFYTWRVGLDGKLFHADCEYKQRDDRKIVVSYDMSIYERSKQTYYFIDEAGTMFGSRDWAYTGTGLLLACSQHRHFGDEWYLATQDFKDIDVALVRKIQDYCVCRNRSLLRVGMFRQPDDFKVHHYDRVPTGAAGVVPLYTETFGRDNRVLETFDTTRGRGHRRGRLRGDLKRKKSGVPWKYFLAGMILVPILIFFVIYYGLTGGLKKVQHMISPPRQVVTNAVVKVAATPDKPGALLGTLRSRQAASPVPVSVQNTNIVKFVGFARTPEHYYLFLSDGRKFITPEDIGEIRSWNKRELVLTDGTRYVKQNDSEATKIENGYLEKNLRPGAVAATYYSSPGGSMSGRNGNVVTSGLDYGENLSH